MRLRKYILGFILLLITVFGFAFRNNLITEIKSLYKIPVKVAVSKYEISKEDFLSSVSDEINCQRLGGNDAIAIWDTASNKLVKAYFYVDKQQLTEFNARKLNTLAESMVAERVNMMDWISAPKPVTYYNLPLDKNFVQGIGREWFENLSLWVQKFGALNLEIQPFYNQEGAITSLQLTCTRNTQLGIISRKWDLPNAPSQQHINELILTKPSNSVTKKWLNQWPIHPKKYELRISRWNYN
jgi:hypothetical protein